MLKVALITYAIGALVLIPSLVMLFRLFKGQNPASTGAYGSSTGEFRPAAPLPQAVGDRQLPS
jgi:hypothetical protein